MKTHTYIYSRTLKQPHKNMHSPSLCLRDSVSCRILKTSSDNDLVLAYYVYIVNRYNTLFIFVSLSERIFKQFIPLQTLDILLGNNRIRAQARRTPVSAYGAYTPHTKSFGLRHIASAFRTTASHIKNLLFMY